MARRFLGIGGLGGIANAADVTTTNTFQAGQALLIDDATGAFKWGTVGSSTFSGNTDGVAEGTTNLYFTQARARGSVSGSGMIS